MKRVLKTFAFLAAVSGALWAMKDRFISLAIPREPQPPGFRPAPAAPQAPVKAPTDIPDQSSGDTPIGDNHLTDDLQKIKGIGPVYAKRLAAMGIATFVDLAASSADQLAEKLDTLPQWTSNWIEQAKKLSS